jgi:hypothetical protein
VRQDQKRYADPISTVGASLLAMDLNDNACCLEKYAAFEFIASRLAPTLLAKLLILPLLWLWLRLLALIA